MTNETTIIQIVKDLYAIYHDKIQKETDEFHSTHCAYIRGLACAQDVSTHWNRSLALRAQEEKLTTFLLNQARHGLFTGPTVNEIADYFRNEFPEYYTSEGRLTIPSRNES